METIVGHFGLKASIPMVRQSLEAFFFGMLIDRGTAQYPKATP